MYEDICLENIKKLYKSSSKYNDQQKYKSILEAEIVFTLEELSENTPMDVGMLGNMKNPGEINPSSEYVELLDVTKKLLSIMGAAKKSTRHPYIHKNQVKR